MKILFNLFAALIIFNILSCKRPTSENPVVVNPTGDLLINFKNEVDGVAITQGGMNYTNASGNMYGVDLLKYYVSSVILVKDDGSEYKLNNYDLINAFDAGFSNIFAQAVPNGNYTSMKFNMGVDAARNHTGAQDGDLDPSHNMIWTWSTGYIFFKHEGSYKNIVNETKVMQYHLGTDKALSFVQIPISLMISGANKTMNVGFNLNKMYNSPKLDFNTDSIRMSSSASDNKWIADMAANTNDAFYFKGVE